ncbi:MAG: 3-keto-5-aminohexanoate cleavage protein [Lachnospiraceae bacterium]|nr:3-keto-5-aminohexanoate cleavage protein [Lachnospiraceae bacterium]
MKKIMLCVAPVAAGDPLINPRAIALDVYDCFKAGAAMVHLHVRDLNGRLTPCLALLEETAQYIRELCDIIIEVSTGGVSDLTIEERVQPCYASWVEAVSLNVGSVNLGEAVYQNPIKDVRYCVKQIAEYEKIPETELFELGMANTLRELDEVYHLPRPLLLALVFGHPGEMPATHAALMHMIGGVEDNFGREDFRWGYTQAHRTDFSMVRTALKEGADALRIGFEDSDHITPDKRADTNAQLIEETAGIIREMGFETMSPDEMRRALNIPPLNRDDCFRPYEPSGINGCMQNRVSDVRKAEKQNVEAEVVRRTKERYGGMTFKGEEYVRIPKVPGSEKMGVHSINALEDKIFLKEFTKTPYVKDIVVCTKGSFEGREFAKSMEEAGRKVTILDPAYEKVVRYEGRTFVEKVITDRSEYDCDLFVSC